MCVLVEFGKLIGQFVSSIAIGRIYSNTIKNSNFSVAIETKKSQLSVLLGRNMGTYLLTYLLT